ncbi:unnamed protein product [Gordionus sp. m RMFG-2023]
MNDFITNAMTAKSDRPNQKKRQRLSVKKNCLSRISFTQDGSYLKCIRIYDIHNHDRDLSLFMASSRQRQLDDDQKTIIHQALKYDGNLTLIHQEMKKKFFIITKRDLYNLKHKYMKNPSLNKEIDTDIDLFLEQDITNQNLQELPIEALIQIPKTLSFQKLFSK